MSLLSGTAKKQRDFVQVCLPAMVNRSGKSEKVPATLAINHALK